MIVLDISSMTCWTGHALTYALIIMLQTSSSCPAKAVMRGHVSTGDGEVALLHNPWHPRRPVLLVLISSWQV